MSNRREPILRNRAASKRQFLAGWFFSGLFVIANSCAGADPAGRIEKSGEWDRIQDGEYLIENCTWNVRAAHSNWQETIFCDPATGSRGWRWDFSGEKDGETKT